MMELMDHLRGLEERLLDSSVRKDAAEMVALLAEDFREFGSSGRIFSRAEVVGELASEDRSVWSLADFEVKVISARLALVTYRAVRESAEGVAAQSLRSSLWELRSEGWQMIFHQGTKIPAE